MSHNTKAEQPATQYGCLQTPLPNAHFQTALWKATGMSSPPIGEMNGSKLDQFFTHASDEVFNLVNCGCKLDAKQHSAVLNSALPAQSFANVWAKPAAKTQ